MVNPSETLLCTPNYSVSYAVLYAVHVDMHLYGMLLHLAWTQLL